MYTSLAPDSMDEGGMSWEVATTIELQLKAIVKSRSKLCLLSDIIVLLHCLNCNNQGTYLLDQLIKVVRSYTHGRQRW